MERDTNPTAAYFTADVDRFAAQYGKKSVFKDRLRLFLDSVQQTTPLPARVLDFGSGPGVISVAMGQLGYDVTGIDGASGMVETAQSRATNLNLSKVRFMQADATQFDPALGPFDAVICSSVIEYVKDDIGLVKKFIQSLKPGGHLLISVPHTASLLCMVEKFMQRSRYFLRRQGSANLAFVLNRYHRDTLLGQLRDMGMEDFKCTTFEFPLFGKLGIPMSRSPLLGVMLLVQARKAASPAAASKTSQGIRMAATAS